MTEKPLSGTPKYRTSDDYLAAERQSATKNEFMNGRVIGRSGSNRWHNLIVSNAAVAIGSRIHGAKSDLYLGNMRVRLRNNFICYPDIVVVNGEPAFADQNGDFGFLGGLGGTPGYHGGAVGQDPGATGYNNSHVDCAP